MTIETMTMAAKPIKAAKNKNSLPRKGEMVSLEMSSTGTGKEPDSKRMVRFCNSFLAASEVEVMPVM